MISDNIFTYIKTVTLTSLKQLINFKLFQEFFYKCLWLSVHNIHNITKINTYVLHAISNQFLTLAPPHVIANPPTPLIKK